MKGGKSYTGQLSECLRMYGGIKRHSQNVQWKGLPPGRNCKDGCTAKLRPFPGLSELRLLGSMRGAPKRQRLVVAFCLIDEKNRNREFKRGGSACKGTDGRLNREKPTIIKTQRTMCSKSKKFYRKRQAGILMLLPSRCKNSSLINPSFLCYKSRIKLTLKG